MIILKDIKLATVRVAVDIPKKMERQLAGDLQNWLMREKSIICTMGITKGMTTEQ